MSHGRYDERELSQTVWWHGSPSGDLRGGPTGLHLGTRRAAEDALYSRIGIPVEGTWDGTREYGQTLICGRRSLEARGVYAMGFNCESPACPAAAAGGADYFPTERAYRATYGNGMPIAFESRPIILAVRIVGPMVNTPETPYEDFAANGRMAGLIRRKMARRGIYYRNVSEDEGSISAVVPGPAHVERVL